MRERLQHRPPLWPLALGGLWWALQTLKHDLHCFASHRANYTCSGEGSQPCSAGSACRCLGGPSRCALTRPKGWPTECAGMRPVLMLCPGHAGLPRPACAGQGHPGQAARLALPQRHVFEALLAADTRESGADAQGAASRQACLPPVWSVWRGLSACAHGAGLGCWDVSPAAGRCAGRRCGALTKQCYVDYVAALCIKTR